MPKVCRRHGASARTLDVRGSKGGKEGVGFFGAEAAQLLRAWLGARRDATLDDYLFVDRSGRSPHPQPRNTHTAPTLTQGKTEPESRPSRAQALRSDQHPQADRRPGTGTACPAARIGGDGPPVRYIAKPEISRKFRRASPLDNLLAER